MHRFLIFLLSLGALAAPGISRGESTSANLAINVTAVQSGTDPTVGLLPADRSAWANWHMAGLQSVGGIPNRTTVCATVKPTGVDPTDYNNITAAIASCPAGQVIILGAGTFLVQTAHPIQLNKSITIRGAGPCRAVYAESTTGYPNTSQVSGCTLVARTDGASLGSQGGPTVNWMFLMGPNPFDNSLSTTALLATDAVQGATTIQVASTTGFSVGQVVVLAEHGNLQWQSDWVYGGQVWQSPDYRITWTQHYPLIQSDECYGAPCVTPPTPVSIPDFFCFGNNINCDLFINEMKQIAAVGPGPCPGSSCTVTFDDPVMIAYRTASPYNALLGAFTQTATTYAGLENMTVQNANDSDIRTLLCNYCWVKNVENTMMVAGAEDIISSFRFQIEGNYDHRGAYPYIGGGGYTWILDTGSSEALIENSISILDDKVDVVRAAGAGSVFAYNYMDMGFCADGGCGDQGGEGFVAIESGCNASHWMGAHHVLFEGNWCFNLAGDSAWGTNPFETWVRNYAPGFRTAFTDYIHNTLIDDANNIPGGNGPLRSGSLSANYYWNSYIGNVLGTSGKASTADGYTYLTYNSPGPAIFTLGASLGDTGGNNGDPEEICDISVASPTCIGISHPAASACIDYSGTDKCPAIRNINYDYLNNAVEYDPNNSDHTLPNSFYLSSVPSFFSNGSGYTWPWVTPQGSSQLQSGPTTAGCTSNSLVKGPCSGLPAKARVDNGTPFTQP